MKNVLMFQSLIFLCASHITQSHQLKNGGVKFLKTTPAVKEKEELDCIDIVENNFVYQMNNACTNVTLLNPLRSQMNQIIKHFNLV